MRILRWSSVQTSQGSREGVVQSLGPQKALSFQNAKIGPPLEKAVALKLLDALSTQFSAARVDNLRRRFLKPSA